MEQAPVSQVKSSVSWHENAKSFRAAAVAFEDEPLSGRQKVQIVTSTHFVSLHAPQTSADHAPSFTG